MKTAGLIVVGLGAIGLGGIAALMLKKKKEEAAAPPGAAPAPGLPAIPGLPGLPPGVTPTPPAPPSPTGLVFVQDAFTVHLKQGQYYRGRGKIRGISLPPFDFNATEDQIVRFFSTMGFVDVRVFMNIGSLPSDWPRETTLNPEAGTRWFQGKWTGATVDLAKAPEVEMVWITASPAVTAQASQAGQIQAQAVAVSGVGPAIMTG